MSKIEEDKIKRQLVRYRAKLESTFRQAQTLNDMIKDLADQRVQCQFITGSRVIDRQRYESILDTIVDLELELKPDYVPNYEPLVSFDSLHANILTALDKLNLDVGNSQEPMPKERNSEQIVKLTTNLPPINIASFSGQIQDWPRFRDLFTSLIIDNQRLSKVEKLHYLVSSVAGRALELIKNYPLSENNFDIAWNALKERYDSSRVLAAYYFDELSKHEYIPQKQSLDSLQRFLTKVNDNVIGLKCMKLDDLSDFLIFSLAIKQLDPHSRKHFESQHNSDSFPSYDSLVTFVKNECRLLEITDCLSLHHNIEKTANKQKTATRFVPSHKQSVLTTVPNTSHIRSVPTRFQVKCPLCQFDHHLFNCSQFIALNIQERYAFVKKRNLCFNCLGSHELKNCRSIRNCPVCGQRHHRLLHRESYDNFSNMQRKQDQRSSTSSAPPDRATLSSHKPPHQVHTSLQQPYTSPHQSQTSPRQFYEPPSINSPATQASISEPVSLATLSSSKNITRRSVVLLGTACAHIKDSQNKFIKFRLVIDCASTASFITRDLVERLGLETQPLTQQFCGLSSTPVVETRGTVKCTIKPIGAKKPLIVSNALVIDNILHSLPSADLPESVVRYFHCLQLADPEFNKSRSCDVLLGLDVFPRILTAAEQQYTHPELAILNTIFGHVILGPLTVENSSRSSSSVTLFTFSPHNKLDDLQNQVTRFWEVESVSSKPSTNPSDDYCEKYFSNTHRRDTVGRYIVALPFTCDPKNLDFPKSRDVALQRFYSLESRFRKNPALKKVCVDFLKEYQSLGHMIKANRPGKYFIPYFCVFNPLSPTTPVRVVFDGSARTTHLSLNQVLFPGPKLQNEVSNVLMNFRIHPYVFTCDISKMFRQILIDDWQCQFLHILFREDPSQPLEEYELRTVTYGLSPSSYLSHRTLIQLTKDEGAQYPLAVTAILENTCVDDFLTGSSSLSGLMMLKNQLCDLLDKGGFTLNKWSSNSPEFISLLKASKKETQSALVIRDTDDHSVKVLGLGWNPESDCFFYMLEPPPNKSKYTKRQVLSSIAKIYDPLGFLSPMIFLFKCILKDIWLSGVSWDESIPEAIAYEWDKCITQLCALKEIRIPRCIFIKKVICSHLLGFCDGSLKGSAAALYLRVQYADYSIRIFLLKSKSRVAPTKVQTIPRLELIGACLLSQLKESVQPFLSKIELPVNNIFFFSDSTIVLSWLRKPPHQLKTFISHRVSDILEKTLVSQWHHVTTDMNISDVASRGLTPFQLINNSAWFEGPSWAYQPLENWPLGSLEVVPDVELPEIKNNVLLTRDPDPPAPPDWLYKYSSFSKLQRIIAYILRFIFNTRSSPGERRSGLLSVKELEFSLTACVKLDQKYYFNSDLKKISTSIPCSNKILSLSPFIDSAGILRVGGRLKNSSLSFKERHPILLFNDSPLTHLIISHFHRTYLHAGARTLSSLLARRFWILSSRRTLRKIIFRCVRCSRFRSTLSAPPMGELPTDRVTPNRPFFNCSVDLAGPYTIKEGMRRNAKTFKAYFALFICFSVKAVHIEVLTSLSSDCFIAALNRFVSRRGLPASIYCDQATNFKGAARQLGEIVEFLRQSESNDMIKSYMASQGIQFKFSVPRAPHMNGLAESNIKNVKYHLCRAIGNQTLTLEEFSTITVRIEAILNSRPLYALSSSPDDLKSLTPGHFLIGAPLVALPEENLEKVAIGRLSRWQLVSQITKTIWRRWEQEYLHTLQNKNKWFHPETNLSEGQLVWLKEDNSPPLSYPLGRIAQVHPGKDGIVRAATVRTGCGTYKRPIRKMAPLPSS